MTRQIILDTETTGLEPSQGHRIIEIGAVEMLNRRLTGNRFHQYLNPEREIDAGAIEVHGITNARLVDKPKFADIAADFLAFVQGAELVIHNAPFDLGFLNAEFERLGKSSSEKTVSCCVDSSDSILKLFCPLDIAKKTSANNSASNKAPCSSQCEFETS